MENSTASSKTLARKTAKGRRSTLAKRHSRNGSRPPVPVHRRNALPVIIGVTGMGCLLALLYLKRARMGAAGELMHEGMDHFHDAIEMARKRMRDATEESYPKAQALAANVGSNVRRWIGRRFSN